MDGLRICIFVWKSVRQFRLVIIVYYPVKVNKSMIGSRCLYLTDWLAVFFLFGCDDMTSDVIADEVRVWPLVGNFLMYKVCTVYITTTDIYMCVQSSSNNVNVYSTYWCDDWWYIVMWGCFESLNFALNFDLKLVTMRNCWIVWIFLTSLYL